MHRISCLAVVMLMVSGVAILFVAPEAKAATTYTWTSTADFDGGTKSEPTVARSWFATNGISQPHNFINYPSAAFYNGRTYVVWQGPDSTGNSHKPSPYITYYDHSALTWASNVRIADGPLTDDDHGAPVLLIDGSGFIHVFYGSHAGALKYRKSTSSESIAAWTVMADPVGVGGARATYPKPILVGSIIYLLFRESNSNDTDSWQVMIKSANGGVSWGAVTRIIDFSAAGTFGIYVGPAVLSGTKIHLTWTTAEEKQAYHAYLETASDTMFSQGGTNLGATVSRAEAEANCLIESSLINQSGFGAVKVDGSGNPYVIYRFNDGLNWNHRFSRWTGAAWSSPVTITAAKTNRNFADFIVTSSTNIEAFIAASGLDSTGRGGNIQRWTWNGTTWTLAATVLNEKYTRQTLNNPIVPHNFNAGLKLVFTETYINEFGFDVSDELKVYAHSGSAFVTRPLAGGNYGMETNTDNLGIASGALELGSGKGDEFTFAHNDAFTAKWHFGRHLTGTDGANVRVDTSTSVSGQLYMRYDSGSGSGDVMGVISSFTLTGDFSVRLKPTRVGSVNPINFDIAFLNEDEIHPVLAVSPIVDGVFYREFYQDVNDLRMSAYTITNGVFTQVGTTTFLTDTLRWLRLDRAGTTITWYYSTDGSSWTQDETATFTLSGSLRFMMRQETTASRTQQVSVNRVEFTTLTLDAGAYRTSGSWTSPLVNQGGPGSEIVTSVRVDYSGVSSSRYIDSIAVLDDTNGILYEDGTNHISGTTVTVAVPASPSLRQDWKVRVTLAGDGSGTPVVTEVSATTDADSSCFATYSPIGAQLINISWVLIAIGLLMFAIVIFFPARTQGSGGMGSTHSTRGVAVGILILFSTIVVVAALISAIIPRIC